MLVNIALLPNSHPGIDSGNLFFYFVMLCLILKIQILKHSFVQGKWVETREIRSSRDGIRHEYHYPKARLNSMYNTTDTFQAIIIHLNSINFSTGHLKGS